MHAKYQCSIINTSEDMSQVKVFVTDGLTDRRTDRRTDGQMSFNVPRFRERRAFVKGGGQKRFSPLLDYATVTINIQMIFIISIHN